MLSFLIKHILDLSNHEKIETNPIGGTLYKTPDQYFSKVLRILHTKKKQGSIKDFKRLRRQDE